MPQRPFLASYGLIVSGDRVLLQRRFNTGYLDGHWALPSGFVEPDEDALAAATRELREETGLIVQPTDWRLVCTMHRRTSITIVDLFFTTDRFAGEPRICEPDKCDGLAFFPLGDLPHPLAGYVGQAIMVLAGHAPPEGPFRTEGWAEDRQP